MATITGTNGADTLNGTAGNDIIQAKRGDDFVDGKGGDDQIDGGKGDNVIDGGSGDDTIKAGGGNDTVVFSGSITEFTITTDGSSATVVGSGAQGTDSLTEVETLVFDDLTLDLTASNNAPGAFDDTFSGAEDTQITGNVLADNGSGADYDLRGCPQRGGRSDHHRKWRHSHPAGGWLVYL